MNELEKKCVEWLSESGVELSWDEAADEFWWGVPVAPPPELRERLEEAAREACLHGDGTPTYEALLDLTGDLDLIEELYNPPAKPEGSHENLGTEEQNCTITYQCDGIGTWRCRAESEEEAREKFRKAWDAGKIRPDDFSEAGVDGMDFDDDIPNPEEETT